MADKPFPAYQGNGPYIFVCFAHSDEDDVYPEIGWLHERGINLWYDEAISAGRIWREEIGDAIKGPSTVLFYVSEASLASDHCNREINFALDQPKTILPVYLEDVALTTDLEVGLSRVQALHRDQGASYQQHLLNALGQSTSTIKLQPGVNLAGPASQITTGRPRKVWPTMAATTGVLLAVVLALGYYYRDTLMFALVMNAPGLILGDPIEQELGIVTTPDGIRIAYATSGEGPPIVQVLGFGTSLGFQKDHESPLYDNTFLLAMSSRDHLFVRYDGRGFGLSDRDVDDFSLQARVSELEAVVDVLGLERFGLYAASAGGPVGIAFTAQHPERVTRLVLAGAFASMNWQTNEQRDYWERMIALFENNWQRTAVTDMLADLLLYPQGNDLERRIFGALLRRSADGNVVAGLFRSLLQIDSRERAKSIRVPTLVIQARDDALIDMKAGRDLAALVPGSQFEIVEGGHMASSGSTPAVRRRILDFFEARNEDSINRDGAVE